jgi:hypothetical protein
MCDEEFVTQIGKDHLIQVDVSHWKAVRRAATIRTEKEGNQTGDGDRRAKHFRYNQS